MLAHQTAPLCASVAYCIMAYVAVVLFSWGQRVPEWERCEQSVCCRVLQCVLVCCIVVQWYRVFKRVIVSQSIRYEKSVCCSLLQCVAVCCSVLQCVQVCCRFVAVWGSDIVSSGECDARRLRVLQWNCVLEWMWCKPVLVWNDLIIHLLQISPRVAVCCSVLQCAVVYCSVMQYVAVGCNVLQWVAACCSVLQCVAVCNVHQHS